jgi:hypothetical protein
MDIGVVFPHSPKNIFFKARFILSTPEKELLGTCFGVVTGNLFYKHLKSLIMKNLLLLLLLFMMTALSSCSVIGDIFKAGVWVGVLAVIIVVGLIIYFITRGSGKK